MKSITTALSNHFNGALTTISNAWKVTRRDGTVMGFTDHDRTQTIEGVQYIASSGYFRSAITNSATTAVDNLEVQGFLDNEMISEDDLRNGAYDFAEVEIFAYNWDDLSQGILRLRYGYFGEVKLRPSGLFVVELRGLLQLLSQTVGEAIGPDCRADLGDNRCKVKLVPDRRASGQSYSVGDRVVIPDNSSRMSVNLQIKNKSFEWYQTSSYFGIWSTSNAYITNFPLSPKTEGGGGVYYVRPTEEAGYVRRVIDYPNLGDSLGSDVGVSWYTRCEEEGWQVGVLVEFINHGGLLGTVIDVLDTYEIPYDDVVPSDDWIIGGGTVDADDLELDPEECNGVRLTIRFRRNPHSDYDHLEGEIAKVDIAQISFFDFEDEYMWMTVPDPAVVPMQEWGSSFPVSLEYTDSGGINLQPQSGYAMFSHSAWSVYQSGQTINFSDIGVNTDSIDDEKYTLDLTYSIAASEWGYRGGVRVLFYDSNNAVLADESTGYLDLKPVGVWFSRKLEVAVPPLTRSLRIQLFADLAEEREEDGTNPAVHFDYIDGDLVHVDSDVNDDLMQYGGVEYEVIQTGVSGLTQPAITHTLDEEINDGTVILKAVAPLYSFIGTISEVTDNKEFFVSDIDAPDNWFTWGVLTFLSGSNETRAVEVLTWDNTSKKMVIMLPALTPIEVGTKIRVHAGCDKTRAITGCKKFENILNYRGEPEVPGTDQYFKVGGTGR